LASAGSTAINRHFRWSSAGIKPAIGRPTGSED
jgi:hypothetical protein